ncbi:hypothetical protein IPJ63_00850 [Candidatus Nomurabacteria bacterium]|nr:MAG: hypothetical protein IPJ63_00850 [Candidatus Nomurabacteria bacterium]
MEIYSFVIIFFYICVYIVGMFYALVGEYLAESKDLWSPYFTLIGILCLLIASRKVARIIYSAFDNKQFVLMIVLLLSVLVVRYFLNSYRKNMITSTPNTLDSVFL